MLSCHLAYFIALPDARVSRVPLIPLCMPQWRGTCSAQLFIVIGLSGCSISIIKEQATDSLAPVPDSPCSASPSHYLKQMFRGSDTELLSRQKGWVLRVVEWMLLLQMEKLYYTIYLQTQWEAVNAGLIQKMGLYFNIIMTRRTLT